MECTRLHAAPHRIPLSDVAGSDWAGADAPISADDFRTLNHSLDEAIAAHWPDIQRWGADANGGRLYARNVAGNGCVFTVDLPREGVADAIA